MIMTDLPSERREALEVLLPFQREDFAGLFRIMDGLPVIIRLIDPPLHEFLPDIHELMHALADLKIRLQHAASLAEVDSLLEQIRLKERRAQAGQGARRGQPHAGHARGAPGDHDPGADAVCRCGPFSRRPASGDRGAWTSTRRS